MNRVRSSLRFNIIISFIILILTTFTIIGLLIFSRWKESAEATASRMRSDTTEDILKQIDEFISVPLYINESNHNLIENEVVDLNNKKERQVFFSSVIKSSEDEVYSFTFGTENGEYYGARKNKKDYIEIVENNASTAGTSFYYSVTNDLTAGSLVEQTGKFDPRTRDWYKIAKEKQIPVFSPIYKHFVMDDLAISAAYPIYSKNDTLRGVLGTHITLSKINKYLKDISKNTNATAYIIEKNSSMLVANSLEKPNFQTLKDNGIARLTLDKIASESIMEAYKNYNETSENTYSLKDENENYYITIKSYDKEGLNWLIITSIPETQFTSEIKRSIIFSILLSILALIIAISIYMKNMNSALRPIYELINTAENFSKGNFLHRAKIFRNDEIGKLSDAFNKMAEQLYTLINTLEGKVKDRTIELEKTNEKIVYLSYHDQLTGLYNRRYFEETLKELDEPNNYPLTIVMADMNGLKLVNDSLGHAVGDKLLKKVAEVLKMACRKEYVIARLGGDEFVILLPKTDSSETEKVLQGIKLLISKEKVNYVDLSISFGYETKRNKNESTEEILKKAEDFMYKQKLFEGPSMRGKTINAIINTLNEKNAREEQHSRRVSKICQALGETLGLHESEIKELQTVGLLHDIGKIAIEDSILNKPGKLTEEEWEQIKRHPEIGYRILSTVNDVAELAQYVLAHHERWDGKGYPKGLKGTEIPLISRIISIADAYEAMTSERSYRNALSKADVISNLQEGSGIQFDPELVKLFIDKVLDKLSE